MTRLFHLFTLLFALLYVGSSAAAPFEATTTLAPRPERGLVRRQAVVQGTVCATVPIRVTVGIDSYTLIDGICLCTEAGVLTPDSVLRLNTQLTTGASLVGSAVQLVADLVGGLTNLLGLSQTAGQSAVNDTPATCAYPANSTPQCAGTAGATTLPGAETCSFTCDANYRVCGNSYCIAESQQCVSGLPARRRSLGAEDVDAVVCPAGLEACYLEPSLTIGSTVGWECVDTKKDIESCGGCGFPVAGRAQGEDCTAMAGVSEVACNAGRCEAKTCMRGYKVVGTACVIDDAVKTFWQRAM